jgi:hypothetical protein
MIDLRQTIADRDLGGTPAKADVFDGLGTRAFTVQTVLRTWTGSMVGDGDYSDVLATISGHSETAPIFHELKLDSDDVLPAGTIHDGPALLTDIPLTYAQSQLDGGLIEENQQFFYRLTDAHVHGMPERILRCSRPPEIEWSNVVGWMVWLVYAFLPDWAPVRTT